MLCFCYIITKCILGFLPVQVSEELIRVAILWHEMWHEGLEEASRLYFGERNVKGMFAVLEPLHAMMERGPQTLKETSFNQVRSRSSCRVQSCTNKNVLKRYDIALLYF